MRSIGMITWGALVCACSAGNTDLQIVVHAPADVGTDPEVEAPDTVRLFVGMDERDGTPYIAPEGFARDQARKGNYWLREFESDHEPISADDPAEFRFVLDERAELGIVVAVGYTGDRPTSSAALFHVTREGGGDYSRYPLGLNGAANAADPRMRSRLNQLALWGEGEATCVHVENRRADVDDTGHRTAFIVGSEDDLDCDGLARTSPLECSPEVYLDRRPPHLGELSCVGSFPTPNGAVCALGGPGCTDGEVRADGACARSKYCTTGGMCQCNTWECVRDLQKQNGGQLPGLALVCDMHAVYDSNDLTTGPQLCPAAMTIDIPTNNLDCHSMKAATRTSTTFGSVFDYGTNASVMLERTDCTAKLTPIGSIPRALAVDGVREGGLLVVDLEGGRGLAIPVLFEITTLDNPTPTTACNGLGNSCHFSVQGLPSDVANCLAQPPP